MNAPLLFLSDLAGVLPALSYLMANFFYLDANGAKQGPVSSAQLKDLANQGIITPDTLVENESGKQTKAKNITGLFPHPVPPPISVPQPESKTDTPSPENPFINPPSAAVTSCPHCGEPVTAGEKFCGSCGKSVFVPTQPCPHCGTTVAVGKKVCYHCGKSVLVPTQLCPHCDATVAVDEKVCYRCGKSLIQPCPHCGATMAIGEKVCHRCGKSPSQPVKPTVEPVSQPFSTPDNPFSGNPTPYPSGNTQSNPFAQSYNPPPTSEVGFWDIGFTRFLMPSWISVIWVISIVLNVISFFVSFYFIGRMMTPGHDDYNGIILLLGTVVNIILHLLSLLFDRIALELIIVVFKIEKNTRLTEENTRGMRPKQQ